MNILFFYRVYPNYGGVEVVTTVLANRFIKDGHGVIIASIEQPHIELACQLLPDVKLVKLDYPVCSIKNMRKLHRLIINEKIDIIINQWGLPFMSTLLCRVAIKRTSCKLISVLHGAPNTSKLIIKARDKCETVYNPFLKYIYHAIMYLKEELVKASIRYNCSHCEKYVLLSSHFIKPLSDYAHIKRTENIIAIGNPVTIPVYFEEWELKQKKKQLLYVGRMDYENKRVNRIVEAWKVLYEKYVDWELVLVGEGPYKSTLEEYIRRYDIQRVCFKGFQVSPPIQHYKEASIFLLTSDLEGFGLVVIESPSPAVPVVSVSPIGGASSAEIRAPQAGRFRHRHRHDRADARLQCGSDAGKRQLIHRIDDPCAHAVDWRHLPGSGCCHNGAWTDGTPLRRPDSARLDRRVRRGLRTGRQRRLQLYGGCHAVRRRHAGQCSRSHEIWRHRSADRPIATGRAVRRHELRRRPRQHRSDARWRARHQPPQGDGCRRKGQAIDVSGRGPAHLGLSGPGDSDFAARMQLCVRQAQRRVSARRFYRRPVYDHQKPVGIRFPASGQHVLGPFR